MSNLSPPLLLDRLFYKASFFCIKIEQIKHEAVQLCFEVTCIC